MGVLQTPVSRFGDLLRTAKDLLGDAGDGTEWLVGKKYIAEFGAGSPPRILFVPEARGRLGPPTKLNANYIASMTHACKVYVRGAEDGSEAGRYDAAYALADRVMNVLKLADAARVHLVPGNPEDASPLPDDAYGADLVFEFTFERPIARDVAVWRPGVTAQAGIDPDRPLGPAGNGMTYVGGPTAETPTRP